MERSTTGRARPPRAYVDMVRAAMEKRDISRQDIAGRMGLSVRYVGKMTSGTERPNRDRVTILASILEINPDSLLWAAGYVPEDIQESLFAVPVKKIRNLARVSL